MLTLRSITISPKRDITLVTFEKYINTQFLEQLGIIKAFLLPLKRGKPSAVSGSNMLVFPPICTMTPKLPPATYFTHINREIYVCQPVSSQD